MCLGFCLSENKNSSDEELTENLIEILIKQRAEARKNKDFKKADEIRAQLERIGIALEDKKDGTTIYINMKKALGKIL